MPKFKVSGSVEYCKPSDVYIETIVEAEDEETAIQAALAENFTPYQLIRYTINEYLETEEVEEANVEV